MGLNNFTLSEWMINSQTLSSEEEKSGPFYGTFGRK